MSISLLDIWNFVINFNLLTFIPIFIVFLIYQNNLFDSITGDYTDKILQATSASISFLILFYLIFDVWLNWIDLPLPESWSQSIIEFIKEANT